ncbi:MAG: hypothetical protein NTV48_02155 [Candidatus Vogelbacteria bacterium]|nr:hypothetical protein [Candidatus Vogelbacteria bacterium]
MGVAVGRLIENLFKKHGTELRRSESALYYASEPKNYLDPETGKKYPDLFAMAKEYADYEPYTTTANFSGNEWRAFLNAHPDRSRLSAWGITNPDRITEEIKVDDVDGIGEEQEKGFGVSRRNLGYHPEENDRFTGLNRLRAGMVLTPLDCCPIRKYRGQSRGAR